MGEGCAELDVWVTAGGRGKGLQTGDNVSRGGTVEAQRGNSANNS